MIRFGGKAAVVRPPSMVERKVWGSNLRRFLSAVTGVMVGSPSMLKHAQEPQCSVELHAIGGSPRRREYFVRYSKMGRSRLGGFNARYCTPLHWAHSLSLLCGGICGIDGIGKRLHSPSLPGGGKAYPWRHAA